VAGHAGVSRATASLVVRKSPLVGAATRACVEAAMAELGYVYDLGAARMRAARSRTVGVIIPNPEAQAHPRLHRPDHRRPPPTGPLHPPA
jgi:DNA-binding LacI/PurR family transcriptional regulator